MALRVSIIGKDKLTGTLRGIGRLTKGLITGFGAWDRVIRSVLVVGSVKLAADMQKGLREIGTLVGGLTDGEMKRMGRELENIAARSGQAMSKLTKARYDIVSAGFTKAADSATLLSVSADLAVGGVTNVALAADLLTTTLNAYNKTTADAVEISDKLFTIVRLGKTTITELGGTMGRVLAIAGQFGISLDEVGAALATLTAQGQSTEEAATAVRAAIVELLKPTKEFSAVIEKQTGLTIDAIIAEKGLAGGLDAIAEAVKKSGKPMKDMLQNIRSMQAVLPLTGTASETYARNLDAMKASMGATASAVGEMNKAFSIQLNMLKQNASNILRSVGNAIIERLRLPIMDANAILSSLGDIGWDIVAGRIADNMDIIAQIVETFGDIIAFQWQETVARMKADILPFVEVNELVMERIAMGIESKLAFIEELFSTFVERISESDGIDWDALVLPDSDFDPNFGQAVKVVKKGLESTSKSAEESATVHKWTTDQKIVGMKAFGDATMALASINRTASKENFKIWKRAAQVQAIVDTYAGATAAFKALAGIPIVGPGLGFAAAAAAVAAGLARVSMIEKQTFAFGGVVPGATDSIPAVLAPREIVSTSAAADQFGEEIIRMNQLAEGGARGGRGEITVHISAVDARSVEDWVRRNARAFGNSVTFVVEKGFAKI